MENEIEVFTDGGSVPNPGPGAWAALLIVRDPSEFPSGTARFLSEYESDPTTTNNKMELSAAIHALRAFKKGTHVIVHTDSEYLKKGMEEWIFNWRANGWLTKDKKPVKNKNLWLELERELPRHRVQWGWVQAHSNSRYNNFVDWLVADAIKNRRGRQGRMSVDELEKFIDTLKMRVKR